MNPQDAQWFAQLGIGQTPAPAYVVPNAPDLQETDLFTDDPQYAKFLMDAEDEYFTTNGLDPLTCIEQVG